MANRVPPVLAVRIAMLARDRCEYCHAPQVLTGQTFHIDHIIPRSAGGQTVIANLCLACSHCNFAKGPQVAALDPRTRAQTPLFHPRQARWDEHFRWSSSWSRLIGRTAIGRATIQALGMNARLLVRARPFWRTVGLLP